MLKKRKAEELAAEIQALKSKARGSSELGPSMYDQHQEMHDLWSGAEDDSEYESHGAMDISADQMRTTLGLQAFGHEDHSADQMSSIVRMGI